MREADVMAAEQLALLECGREVCEQLALLECGREYSHNIIFSVAMLLDNFGNLAKPPALHFQGTTAAALSSASPQASGAASGRGCVLGGRGSGGGLSHTVHAGL